MTQRAGSQSDESARIERISGGIDVEELYVHESDFRVSEP